MSLPAGRSVADLSPAPERRRAPSVGQVIGNNLRELRESRRWSRTEVARRAVEAGLVGWTHQTIGLVERAERALAVEEMLVLPLALGVSLRDLFAGDGPVLCAELYVEDLAELRALFVKTPRVNRDRYLTPMTDVPAEVVREAARWWPEATPALLNYAAPRQDGEAEWKAARRLGVTPLVVTLIAFRLWGRSLTHTRDLLVEQRVGPNADRRSLQAHRGHVTRELVAQLAEIVARRHGATP